MSAPSSRDRARFERYLARMDRGEHWLAHEELEALWLDRREDEFKGLIHLAAALLHARRGNRGGAATKARSALRLLGDVTEVMGLRVEPVRELAARLRDAVERGDRLPEALTTVRLSQWYQGDLASVGLEDADLPYRVRRYEDGYRTGRDPDRRD